MKLNKNKIIDDFRGLGDMIEISCSKFYTGGQSLYICKNSGLVRAKNLRTSEQIANAWSNEVYDTNFGNKTYTARVPAVKARQTYVTDFIDSNIGLSGKNICDIGAGEGQFFEIIQQNKYQTSCFGIEPSTKNSEEIKKKGFECFCGTIEEYAQSKNFTQKKFDVITIMWTLVNTASCLDMVKLAYDMLKPGGYIVVAEGSRILVPFKKPLNYYFSKLPVDLHPYHFSANSLSNLLKVNGFQVERLNSFIDTDYLCILAKKDQKIHEEEYEVDDYKQVESFFQRWHLETQNFYSNS